MLFVVATAMTLPYLCFDRQRALNGFVPLQLLVLGRDVVLAALAGALARLAVRLVPPPRSVATVVPVDRSGHAV